MGERRVTFRVSDDTVIKYTPILGMENAEQAEMVIDRETFIKCYERWIKEREGKE